MPWPLPPREINPMPFKKLKQRLAAKIGSSKGDDRALALERELQSLRLDLQEREQALAFVRWELERQQKSEKTRLDEAVHLRLERLLAELATPIAQLATQAYLFETEVRPVQAKDILATGKRFLRVLEASGLTVESHVGETVSFDPNHHESLSAEMSLEPNEKVVVRFVGLSYRGKTLRKAGVERP
jgi:molecular chaperone GrpE (heat shock protein)